MSTHNKNATNYLTSVCIPWRSDISEAIQKTLGSYGGRVSYRLDTAPQISEPQPFSISVYRTSYINYPSRYIGHTCKQLKKEFWNRNIEKQTNKIYAPKKSGRDSAIVLPVVSEGHRADYGISPLPRGPDSYRPSCMSRLDRWCRECRYLNGTENSRR